MSPQDFFTKYSPWAENEYIRSGVPASITLAQASLESNWGESKLTKEACNFFGIKKGIGWTGQVYNIDTNEVISGQNTTVPGDFRKYDSPRESFKDHSDFLVSNPRYKNLFNSRDYKSWANELQADGYATAPNYASVLISRIEEYNLTQYDENALKKKS